MSTTQTVETKKCKVEGCKRVYRAKGYCNVHFHKWRRGEMPVKARYKICGEENCCKPLFQFGMCQEHHAAWIASKKEMPAAVAAPKAPAAEAPAAAPAEKPAESAPEQPAKSETPTA